MKYLNKFSTINEERPGRYTPPVKINIDLDKLKSNLEILFNHKDMWHNLRDDSNTDSIYDLFNRYGWENSTPSGVMTDITDEKFISGSSFSSRNIVEIFMFADAVEFIKKLEPKIQELLDIFIVKYYIEKDMRLPGDGVQMFITLQATEDSDDGEDISDDMFLEFFETLKLIKSRHDVKINDLGLGFIKLEVSYKK